MRYLLFALLKKVAGAALFLQQIITTIHLKKVAQQSCDSVPLILPRICPSVPLHSLPVDSLRWRTVGASYACKYVQHMMGYR